jgi:hypothetical protein
MDISTLCLFNETGEKMKFNINENVKVKLTDFGGSVLRKQHDELRKAYSNVIDFPKFQEPEKDENGYSKFQLWALMESLGSYCGMAKEYPFETEIILSTDDSVCEWKKLDCGKYQGCGGQWSMFYKFCPHCGCPIKVITEPEVMELDGVKPIIIETHNGWYVKWSYAFGTNPVLDSAVLRTEPTKLEAITAWNAFASKMKGE